MSAVTIAVEGAELACRSLRGAETLGEPSRLVVRALSREPIVPANLVGRPAAIRIQTGFGARVLQLLVKRATVAAQNDPNAPRQIELELMSPSATLALAERSRIFRDKSLADIVSEVLEQHGGRVARELTGDCPKLPYVVQFEESDEIFVRRLCERGGFFVRETATEDELTHTLADRSADGPRCVTDPLAVTDDSGLREARPCAWGVVATRTRVAGAVRVRDYDADNPAVDIEGLDKGGSDHEQALERYLAPIGAKDSAGAAAQAKTVLEALRATARLVRFNSNAPECAAGTTVASEPAGARTSAVLPPEVFIIGVEHHWEEDDARYEAVVTAIPLDVPFRLPWVTPRPVLSGISSATVTGAPGEDIHCDDAGRVRARFAWDREGPIDDEASLPIRVMQPQLAGSLLTPRVGWEVWTAFEDGDPERPFVLCRADNGKQTPPLGLPENKTCTRIASPASPGGGAMNAITMQDGAGGQGLVFDAGGSMTTDVAANAGVETVADDTQHVGGAHTVSCAVHDVKVAQAFVTDVATQTITAASHAVKTPEAQDVKVASEVVSCASLTELVGSPGGALFSIAEGAVSAGMGFVEGEKLKAALGALKSAYTVGKDTYEKGIGSGLMTASKEALGFLPDSVSDHVGLAMDMAEGAEIAPWQPGKQPWQASEERWKAGEDEANAQFNAIVGGAGVGAPAPGAAGGGERATKTGAAYFEAVGAAYALVSLGSYKHTTLGARLVTVGGLHGTATGKYAHKTLGAAGITTGRFSVKAAAIDRTAKSIFSVLSMGALRETGVTGVFQAGGALKLDCGALSTKGAKLIFKCGGSSVVIDGSGMTIKSPLVKFADATNAPEGNKG